MAAAIGGRLAGRVQRYRRSVLAHVAGEPIMLALAATVGLGTGLLAVALIKVVRLVSDVAFRSQVTPWDLVIVPTVGAFAVGVLVTYLFPESAGSGVVRIMTTIALRGGRLSARVPLGGVASTGVALGTGASGGREGPIVLIGGGLGSLLGRLFAVGEERMRTLIAAGAAAGIGASFNAPIGEMLFAIELIIGGFRARSLQVIVVASVVGSVVARELVGADIIYQPRVAYRLDILVNCFCTRCWDSPPRRSGSPFFTGRTPRRRPSPGCRSGHRCGSRLVGSASGWSPSRCLRYSEPATTCRPSTASGNRSR